MALPELHCERFGSGPDLVMLHGWGLNAGIWGDAAQRLAGAFRLHLYDLPGHGRSGTIDSFTLDAIGAALAEQAPARAHWLGWSLGGALALAFAARHPARVDRLVLVASNPRFTATDDWPNAMAPEVLQTFAQDLVRDHPATVNRFLSLVARGAPDAAVLRGLRRSVADAPPPTRAALEGGLTILRGADLRAQLDALQMPALCIGGERDTLVPIAALRCLAERFPHVQLQEIAQAGHAPFLSHPAQFAAAVRDFLQ